MRKLLLGLCLALLAFSCSEDDLILVKQFALKVPASAPVINRSVLVSGTSFAPGYQNGNIRSNRVTIQWQGAGDPEFLAYRVFRNSFPIGSFVDVAATTLTDSNLSQNAFYHYMVAVQNQEGNHRSDTITVKTPLFLPPLVALQVQADTSVRITMTRRAESSTSYSIDRSANGAAYVSLTSVTDSFYVDRAVQYGSFYSYRVTAANQFESTAPTTTGTISIVFLLNDGFESGTLSGWSTGGNLSWSASAITPIAGTYSARSGAITHNQTSFIQRTVSFVGSRTITFRHRVSSEAANDVLRFLINNVVHPNATISGESGVQTYTTTFTGTGSVTLRWEYVKNASISTGTDAAWIDNVIIP